MGARERREPVEAWDLLEDLLGEQRVVLEPLLLVLGERARLVEDPVRDRELADVVEQRCSAKLSLGGLVESEHRAHSERDRAHTIAMLVRPRRFRVDHGREPFGDRVQPVLVGGQDPIGGLDRGHVRRGQRVPEAIVTTERAERLDQCRVKPGPAPLDGDAVSDVGAASGVKHLDRLCQAHDPGQQRNVGSAEPNRLPVAVPVLVECLDGVGCRFGEPELERDLGAAVTARLHQRPRNVAFVADRSQPAGAVDQRSVRSHGLDRPRERRQRTRPVHQLGRMLRRLIVRAEQRGHVRRVRRAPGVLQQQRIEQVRSHGRVESEFVGHAHPNQARPHGVARRLSFRDVQGARQRANQLGQRDLAGAGHHLKVSAQNL